MPGSVSLIRCWLRVGWSCFYFGEAVLLLVRPFSFPCRTPSSGDGWEKNILFVDVIKHSVCGLNFKSSSVYCIAEVLNAWELKNSKYLAVGGRFI